MHLPKRLRSRRVDLHRAVAMTSFYRHLHAYNPLSTVIYSAREQSRQNMLNRWYYVHYSN